MSILSKILVVLLVVLTIALSVAVMVVHRNYLGVQTNFEQFKDKVAQENAAYVGAQTDYHKTLTVQRGDIDKLTSDKAKVEGQLALQIEDAKRLNDALAKATNQVAGAELMLASTQGNLQTASAERNAAVKDLADQRSKIETLQKENTQYAQKLTETEAAKTFLIQQNKLQSEQIVDLQHKLTEGTGKQSSAGSVRPAGAVETVGATLKGHITAVSDDLATVDVGKVDGVEPGMRFFVFRDRSYLADLVISRVETSSAVGRLELVKQRVQVKDNAWNRLEEN